MKPFLLILSLFITLTVFGQADSGFANKAEARFDGLKMSSTGNYLTGLLEWSVYYRGERVKGKVMKFKRNRWVRISKFKSLLNPQASNEIKFSDSARVPLINGPNKFRIVLTSPVQLKSLDIDFNMAIPKEVPEKKIWTVDQMLDIGYVAEYTIYDDYENIMLEGNERKVDISTLKNGHYILKVKGKSIEFMKTLHGK
jgi:hypothetical protein